MPSSKQQISLQDCSCCSPFCSYCTQKGSQIRVGISGLVSQDCNYCEWLNQAFTKPLELQTGLGECLSGETFVQSPVPDDSTCSAMTMHLSYQSTPTDVYITVQLPWGDYGFHGSYGGAPHNCNSTSMVCWDTIGNVPAAPGTCNTTLCDTTNLLITVTVT